MNDNLFKETHKLQSKTGASIAYRHLPAQNKSKGVLLIAHGLIEHSGRYERFAKFISQQGYHIYAFDHRGHGYTTAPDAPIGRFAWRNGTAVVIEDVINIRDFAASQHPDLPIIIFGHSMGGLIALATATYKPHLFNGLAIWNSDLFLGPMGRVAQIVLRISQMLKGSDVPSVIMAKSTFESWNQKMPEQRTRADWLSHDKKEVDAYISDPLCQFQASVSMWQDVIKFSYLAGENIANLQRSLPIHIIGGTDDPATDYGVATVRLRNRLQELKFNNVSHGLYKGMRHETVHEVNWEQAAVDFTRWLDTNFDYD